MSYYTHHLFFCTNERQGEASCSDHNARAMRDYAKQKAKDLGIHREGGIRVNLAGCLGRCELGPVLVVYPEGVWYTYVDEEDIDDILTEHIQQGRPVERLKL